MNNGLCVRGEKRTIIMVDDNISNLATGKAVLKDKFDVFTVPSAGKFFLLMRAIKPDLILLDIEMPEMNGYAILRRLQEENPNFDIPVIFLTAKTDPGSELEGLALGAADYIFKPFSPLLLIKRIENCVLMAEQQKELKRFNANLRSMMRLQSNQIMELQSSVMDVIANIVEFRDDVTGNHVARTKRFMEIMIDAMIEHDFYAEETKGWEVELLLESVQLHDVGKIGISDTILNKPGKLTAEEYAEIQTHVEIGERILDRIRSVRKNSIDHNFLKYAEILISYHHEKWDGSGYPHKLAGEDIPLLGRLMAIADVYEALISKRSYKEAMSAEVADGIMMEGKGTFFEPRLVDFFMGAKAQINAVAGQMAE
ncbi:two-component system response regulator [Clostridia bacterium]|nr:two-component system response regulator [Clostridia bacterium]